MSSNKVEFSRAVELRDKGKPQDALAILHVLSQKPDATAAVFGVMGSLLWETESADSAIPSFQRATALSPHSEVASLGLFHTLFESGRTDDAFDEMRRFLKFAESEEYQSILDGLSSDQSRGGPG